MIPLEKLGCLVCPVCRMRTGVPHHPELAGRPIRVDRTGICMACYQKQLFELYCRTNGITVIPGKGPERKKLASELRAFGMTYRGIAAALGYKSLNGVHWVDREKVQQWDCPGCGRQTRAASRPDLPGVVARDGQHRCQPCHFASLSFADRERVVRLRRERELKRLGRSATQSAEEQEAAREHRQEDIRRWHAQHRAKAQAGRAKRKAILVDEVMHFRAFGWNVEKIAEKLGVTVNTVAIILFEHNMPLNEQESEFRTLTKWHRHVAAETDEQREVRLMQKRISQNAAYALKRAQRDTSKAHA